MKPKDPIWNFFTILKDKKKTTKKKKTKKKKKNSARCKDCNIEVSAKVLRLKNHRQKCLGLKKPESIAKRPLKEITSEPETLSNDQPPAKRPKLQQTSFSSFVVSTDCSMWKQLDEQIARLFYACDLPLNVADYPMWKKTYQIINQKAILIINQPTDHHNLQLTTKNIQSTIQYFNRPVLTNRLNLPVKTAPDFDRPTLLNKVVRCNLFIQTTS